MSKLTFFVCGNTETLCQGTYLQHSGNENWSADAVVSACRLIDDNAGCSSTVNSMFHDWHGGRFDQFFYRSGFVAVAQDAPKWAHDLADQADSIMKDELLRAEQQAEARDRVFFAECLETDQDVPEKFIKEMLFPAAMFSVHTRASIAAALRANDASLLVNMPD